MITDIPTDDAFTRAGKDFLNLAWNTIMDLYHQVEAGGLNLLPDDEVSDEYWTAAQRPLYTAVTLISQGAEFLLKGRIAAVSPFLLLSGGPRDWPTGSRKKDVAFSRFRTIDAQDLPHVHDTVCATRLSDDVITLLDRLRDQRNTIVHGVDPHLRVSADNLMVELLEVSHQLIGDRQWVTTRWEYHPSSPESAAHSTDHIDAAVSDEVVTAINHLTRALVERYFGFDKKQRRYICSRCSNAMEWGDPKSALLDPNTPESTMVKCFVCFATEHVERSPCASEDCPGNVLGRQSGTCLTCGADIPRLSMLLEPDEI